MRDKTAAAIVDYVKRCSREAYSEPLTEVHNKITAMAIDWIRFKVGLKAGWTVLDVGSGAGEALAIFKERGLVPVGINLHVKDARVVIDRGFECLLGDFHELSEIVKGQQYDLCFARHSLEHSPMPGFVLEQMYMATRPGGYVYVEVPMPDTDCRHETNPDHWFVAGRRMWEELIRRAGYKVIDGMVVPFVTGPYRDVYLGLLGVKELAN